MEGSAISCDAGRGHSCRLSEDVTLLSSFDDPLTLEPDVVAYAYAVDHNTHIPARRFTLCRFVERSWTTDYGTRRQVREALRYAVNQANSGHDMRDWDDPVAY